MSAERVPNSFEQLLLDNQRRIMEALARLLDRGDDIYSDRKSAEALREAARRLPAIEPPAEKS